MTNKAFDLAREAMTSLEFFRGHYSSGDQYQQHFQQVLGMLRGGAANAFSKGEQYGDKKFLLAFADALEQANRSGEYVPLAKREGSS